MAALITARRSSRLLGIHAGRALSQSALELDSSSYIPVVRRVVEEQHKEDAAAVVSTARSLQWVFLGCPGVGKGTYASRLATTLAVPHIAMGDLVRQELKQSTPLAREMSALMAQGKLLPDEIILAMLKNRFEQGALSNEAGFILDGFPRTTIQAKALDDIVEIDLVVNLKLREDVLVLKCLGRRICSHCGGTYNVAKIDVEQSEDSPRVFMPPLLPPPACAATLTVRTDDTEEVVRERLRIYAAESKPVEDYYRERNKLQDFDVCGGIPETWPRLLAALNVENKGMVP
ncbi:hypothetical protein SELMODRAFT_160613 [Selaginella moellendorffii]|uniref:adenylate kinase n=1 Tax=Selaginella moellendorffii TaxID=88036 RepID=D8T3C7_SELML|nr:probable adenylate kinase 6, chloroplastic [Selaginella moellendorffii]XP_024519663.1 probable adenylate kinase 6, chloroplastic [Selaginella moellendorffii]EFJ08810.1 hypothetical protein SELMODRAFT_160613 [Selaginella moellendorffii]|eukprot:XP_024519341.1 probable adenylate kinase 6, chloroplastic [Selaginella moellendorffii]